MVKVRMVPEGYKQTVVGVIPNDWDVRLLSHCADVKTGPFGSALHERDYVLDGIPIITVEHLGYFGVVHENLPLVSDFDWKRLMNYELKTDDIVFSRVGSVDRNCIVKEKEKGWLFSGRLLRIRITDKNVLPLYLNYHFHFEETKNRIRTVAVGQTMASLNTEILNKFEVVVPRNGGEQQAIAEALNDVDSLIASLDRLIEKKRNIKQGAMQQLLKPTDDCVIKKLGEVADSNKKWSFTGGPFGSNLKSSDYTSEGVRIIQLQNIGDGNFINDSEVYTSKVKADELISCNIYPGDIILSKMGDPVARACIIPDIHDRYLMCSDGIRLSVDINEYNTYYIYSYINFPAFRMLADSASTGSTRKRIGLTELRNLELFVPRLSEQKAIAAVLSDMDAEITALEAKRDKYKFIKQGMMQVLLTGKVRLIQ